MRQLLILFHCPSFGLQIRAVTRHVMEFSRLHIPPSVLKPHINSSLALINTVCLLFFIRKVLRSRLNKPAPGVWSSHRCLLCEWSRAGVREQAARHGSERGGGGFRSETPHLICCKVMKCRYVPLKNTRPVDMCEIYVSSFLPPPLFLFSPPRSSKFKKMQQKADWSIFSAPPPPPPPPPHLLTPSLKEYSRPSSQVKNVYANAGYIRACTGC